MIFATFYADIPGKPSRAAEFARLVKAGAAMLAATTPNSHYLLLTDRASAPAFEDIVETVPIAPDGDIPLMLKYMMAQRALLDLAPPSHELTILADTDDIPNRDLTNATPGEVGLAITVKSAKFNYRVNNLAYVRDPELGIWFLDRAIAILKDWPAEKQNWLGDQESWEAALGDYPRHDGVIEARPEGRLIHLYPCDTHNCPMPRQGGMKQTQRDAYVLHFKGPRKIHLDGFIRERRLGVASIG